MEGDIYPKHMFICTLMAYKPDQALPDVLIVAALGSTIEDALRDKSEINLNQHPVSDGWIEHRQAAMQVPDQLIEELSKQPRAGAPGSMVPFTFPEEPPAALPFPLPHEMPQALVSSAPLPFEQQPLDPSKFPVGDIPVIAPPEPVQMYKDESDPNRIIAAIDGYKFW